MSAEMIQEGEVEYGFVHQIM